MGLLPGSLMPGLVEDLALPGSWMPFGQAAKMIGHFRKIEVWEATVRRFTEKSGQAWVEMQTDRQRRWRVKWRKRLSDLPCNN